MPGFAVMIKRVFLFIVLIVLSFLLYKYATSKPKYQSKHDYASFYKNTKQIKKKNERADLKPNLVYRGTNEKINSSDIGLITSIQEQAEVANGFKDHSFNVLVSRRLAKFRDIPDTRHQTCQNKSYSAKLPTISVIICFYNEHLHTLIRSVESVLRRTPPDLLTEIILVNDGSTHSVDEISYHVSRPEWGKVRQLFTSGRTGLIRSRILGARNATADVLVFLDSHIECNVDWAQPLLHRIKESWSNVAVPIIDSIDPDTFKYKASPLVRGGMTWNLNFKWDQLPQGYFDDVSKFNEPMLSPTMAGGLFAINRKYFQHLGEYDSGLQIWGAENIEISLRIWMCGGRLDIIPCSRVGHVFRKRRPYTSTNTEGEDTQILNVDRVARVWLGDYVKYFYESLPDAKEVNSGDISQRMELKNRLACKDFSWFHKNIYPELLLPGQHPPPEKSQVKFQRWDEKKRNFEETVQLVHNPTGLCVQTSASVKSKGSDLTLQGCRRIKEQTIFITEKKQLLPGGYLCMDANKSVRLQKCTEQEGPQTWSLPQQRNSEESSKIYNAALGLCLGVQDSKVITIMCQEKDAQVWSIRKI